MALLRCRPRIGSSVPDKPGKKPDHTLKVRGAAKSLRKLALFSYSWTIGLRITCYKMYCIVGFYEYLLSLSPEPLTLTDESPNTLTSKHETVCPKPSKIKLTNNKGNPYKPDNNKCYSWLYAGNLPLEL